MDALTNRHYRVEKETRAENASHDCFWDRYWGSAGQLLANFFFVPSNSPRSLFESLLGPVFFRFYVANEHLSREKVLFVLRVTTLGTRLFRIHWGLGQRKFEKTFRYFLPFPRERPDEQGTIQDSIPTTIIKKPM